MSTMAAMNIGVGDLSPPFLATLYDGDGEPIPLTGCTVAFHAWLVGADARTIDAAASVVSATTGHVRYDWSAGDTTVPGTYDAEFQIKDTATNKTRTVPPVRKYRLVIGEAA